ncbi:beta-mannosidase [Carboxylicivirga caseinilyticus]|uniref:beta-mannosidase n=1 Tax=Carboxylicivirga caseinilyticus TaxID=3417572 RepID=UPI003D34D892|nr:glycoside hydrolase family 2 protein [Marinilabiliaceae bacterium A049]
MKKLIVASMCVLGLLNACQQPQSETMIVKQLNDGWTYQQVNGDYSGNATVPGTIHTDLLNNGQIEDPFYRTNEKDLQWIDKEDWVYQTVFSIDDQTIQHDRLVLHFYGLDTYADVYLNDSLVLSAFNMHRQWEADIKKLAKAGENKLKVYLHSPIKKGLELYDAAAYSYPASNDQSENGGLGDKKVSVFTRKAGYHYGWDWGPRFVTSGIWRPVELMAWNDAKVTSLQIKQPMVNAEKAELEAVVEVNSESSTSVEVELFNSTDQKVILSQTAELTSGNNVIELPFEIEKPKLWWSNGLGEAKMYDFEVRIKKGNKLIADKKVSTGIRSIKLVREKDDKGESFLFELNGLRVFAKGANYIPNDNFLPRVSEKDYQKVIADAVNANMNMLRVWGGGIYENDYFYDLCDRNGILIWQDFMFACSMYPGDEVFLNNVRQEAIDNVKRLRNHPSIALWCGNNEINTAWNYYSEGGWGWKQRYTKEQQDEIQKAYLDVFHKILPQVIAENDSDIAYWPSSPQAGYEPDQHAGYETTSGDMHYWGVWHGLHPFEDFKKYKARFISEYGFQSFPDFETVQTYAIPEDYDIESEVMAAHQRSGIGNLRIKEYMSWEYKNVPGDFEQFLYMSHVLQARAAKMAVEAHRREMPYCMGTLYWQINDCWPVASWSSTDYYHKWKAMHYAVKRGYEPVIVSADVKADGVDVYLVSDNHQKEDVHLKVSVVKLNGEVVADFEEEVVMEANTSSMVRSLGYEELLKGVKKEEVILHMEAKRGDEVLAENMAFLVKPKFMELPEVELSHTLRKEGDKLYLDLSADKMVFSLYVKVKNKQAEFSDNYFNMLPGVTYTIEIKGVDIVSENDIELMHLQMVK